MTVQYPNNCGSGDDMKVDATKKVYLDGGTNTYLSEVSGDNMNLVTGGTEAVRIDSSQRVGIGTTSPVSGQGRSLHLASDSDHATFRVEAGSNKDSQIQLANNGALKWNLYNSNSSSDKLFLDTNSINALVIQQNGNVGIGTTSPGAKLEIKGANHDEALVITNSDGTPVKMLEVVDDVDSGNDATVFKSATGMLCVIPQTLDDEGINEAIEYANAQDPKPTVYLPAGVYEIDHEIKLYADMTLLGAGTRATILQAKDDYSGNIIVSERMTTGTYKHNITIANLTIRANESSFDGEAIYLPGIIHPYLENIVVDSAVSESNFFKTGIHLKAWAGSVIGVRVYYCYTGFDLSWDSDIQTGEAAYATNAICMDGSEYWGGSTDHIDSTISTASWTSGKITFTTSAAHTIDRAKVVKITGCSNSNYNGEYINPERLSSTTFSVDKADDPGTWQSGGTPKAYGMVIGCYISGTGNALLGCTIERAFDEDRVDPEYSVGVYLIKSVTSRDCLSNAIIGGYFENLRTNFIAVDARYTTIMGCQRSYYDGIADSDFVNSGSTGINIHNAYVGKFTWNSGEHKWEGGDSNISGRVGLGTASPSYPLDVAGRSRIRGAESYGGGLWLTTSGNPTSDYSFIGRGTDAEAFLGLYNNGGWRLVIDDSSAKVGIGTTSSSEALEVNGNIKGSSLIAPVVKPSSDSTTALQLQNSSGDSILNVDTTNSRIGIGKTDPGAKLTVAGGDIVVRESDDENDAISLVGGVASGEINCFMGGTSTIKLRGNTGYDSYINAGNVGIGTTSPGEKLDVNGNIKTSGYVDVNGPRILSGDVNPASSGVAAPQGSIYMRINGGSGSTIYAKHGSGDTDWSAL